MSAESGLHYYSKIVMASWLRKMAGARKNFKGLNNINFKCESKAPGPMFGVYTEYPVCLDKNTKQIVGLDTTWDNYCKTNSWKAKAKHGIPSKYELKNASDRFIILHIFDVIVMDGDKLAYIFEIKHTHAMDTKKIKFIQKHQIPTFEVSAQWVLERVTGKIPWNLQWIVSICTSPELVNGGNDLNDLNSGNSFEPDLINNDDGSSLQ
jgi:hypothetical protein